MTKYDKLVRDKIPEILESKWIKYTTIQVSWEKRIKRIRNKVQEEVDEFLKDPNIEEMADIIEVLRAFCDEKWINWIEVEKVRLKKIEDRWWFKKWIVLLETEKQ